MTRAIVVGITMTVATACSPEPDCEGADWDCHGYYQDTGTSAPVPWPDGELEVLVTFDNAVVQADVSATGHDRSDTWRSPSDAP